MFQVADEASLDLNKITRELDKTKSTVFLGSNAAFLGSIMCSLNFIWSREVRTAATDSVSLWWNPDFFMQLEPEARQTVLLHELWHAARLHMVRLESRDPKIWNYACVAENTRVAMADGTEKFVQDVQAGDQIAASDSGTSTVAVKINSGVKDIYEIVLESGRVLRCSADHKVLTDAGFKNADTLTSGETCFVDTRYGKPIENQLGNQKHPGNC